MYTSAMRHRPTETLPLDRSVQQAGGTSGNTWAQYVRPFVKLQKNDYLDAEAVGEAVQRPTMRFVPLKTADQLSEAKSGMN